MFNNLTKSITGIFDKIFRSGILSPAQVDDALEQLRIALLEADVSLVVVQNFINEVRSRALGQNIIKSVNSKQMVIKILHDTLIDFLQPDDSIENHSDLRLQKDQCTMILMVGLQASGKTSSSAKLANFLQKKNKKILLASLDTYRPAAQIQLEILAKSIGVDSLEIIQDENPIDITHRAMSYDKSYDVIIFDTAGRLHVDMQMMKELKEIKRITTPHEVILVADALTGQDAVNIAKNFNSEIDITGILLTRMDSDARGGAALSMKYITKKPIKFLAVGEKVHDLEVFDPARIASRILDMGDVISLVEKAAQVVDQAEADRSMARIQKGIFTMEDYASYLRQMKRMGGISSIMGMIPGMSGITHKIDSSNFNESVFARQIAMINSMTKDERKKPEILGNSRKSRIIKGSGTTIQELNRLIKQYQDVANMIKKVSGMKNPMSLFGGGSGGMLSSLFRKK